ncbi:MAG: sigma-70 family RNA polymerase sigma factor [Phocaeicola sp.]|nr:sigma-70 family RNA polymerase sigma factor [Phocaeicola sp.]
MAYNTAISATRKRKQNLSVVENNLLINLSDQQIDDALNDESEAQIEKLNEALKKLNAEERTLISLFYHEEKPVSEVAFILGLAENNVKVKLHRIRKKLYILITEAV